VDLDFSSALLRVRGAMVEAGVKSSARRLTVLQDATCKRKCSGCCRRMIHITVAEAIVLQGHLEKAGTWPAVLQKCSQMLASVRNSNSLAWFRMNVACPVLSEDGDCLAYSVRPATCAVHFALSDPKLCSPWTTDIGEYLPVELEDVFLDFQKTLQSSIDAHGILALKMPLPASLIMAERVRYQPNLTPEALIRLIYNELA
jgi:Fe-S-cluster containining protein